MKRIIILIIATVLFTYFEYYFPIEILNKVPILLSVLFSVAIVFLILVGIINVYSFKRLKGIILSSKKITGMFIFLLMVAVFFAFILSAHFYTNFLDNLKLDLKNNSIKTTGVVLDKYHFTQRRRFQNYDFFVVKVKYKTNTGEITTEHYTQLGLKQLPEIGSDVKILYSANIPENFVIDEVENSTKKATIEDTMKLIESMN
jgi:hypothetical protein